MGQFGETPVASAGLPPTNACRASTVASGTGKTRASVLPTSPAGGVSSSLHERLELPSRLTTALAPALASTPVLASLPRNLTPPLAVGAGPVSGVPVRRPRPTALGSAAPPLTRPATPTRDTPGCRTHATASFHPPSRASLPPP